MKIFFRALPLAIALALPAAPLAAQERPSFDDAGAATQPVGHAYFDAYIARDWDALEPLLADDASFHDATAELVFGGAEAEGKAAMMTLFRDGYEGITRMTLRPMRNFHSGHYSVFEGELDWALRLDDGMEVASVMPFVTILRVEDGRVVSHRDFADYAPFLAALRAARAAAAE
ncbi:MAG: nuclear transport factor 2 family protein [Parasphingopyxis sp.]|uniref:nuclear transport factor 2 family protein n=1 Tax=Parasphingopyxis sp. TaxID=1920299 RepID=UPI003F9F78CB